MITIFLPTRVLLPSRTMDVEFNLDQVYKSSLLPLV